MVAMMIVVALLGTSPGRGDLEPGFGGGVWVPTGADFETSLSSGPLFEASLQIPMELGSCIWLRAGYRSASSDSPAWEGVSCVPLQIGYRIYPLYRRYAGPRGLEPFVGLGAGGFVAWDEPADDGADGVSSGGGMLSLELGTRVRLGERTSMDVLLRPEWMPCGKELAGEDDLSGLSAGVLLHFAP